jgi:hypothetical protein
LNNLPQFLADMIACPPPAGNGVHSWLFRTARHLHAHRSPTDIVQLLAASVEGCGRHVPRSEIEAAVRNSLACAWRPDERGTPSAVPPRWPALNRDKRPRVTASGISLADLWEASPVRMDEDGPGAEDIIDALFPGNPLLCCAYDQRTAVTREREELRGEVASLPFVVPSPMAARTGRTKEGKESARCLENVGPRRFLVVEFDTGTTDEHAALLWHLADFAPLALVVHSGGKSLHGWFRAADHDATTRRFFEYAVSLGADHATWTPCQLVRMPEGRRTLGQRQVVWFFNPEVAR